MYKATSNSEESRSIAGTNRNSSLSVSLETDNTNQSRDQHFKKKSEPNIQNIENTSEDSIKKKKKTKLKAKPMKLLSNDEIMDNGYSGINIFEEGYENEDIHLVDQINNKFQSMRNDLSNIRAKSDVSEIINYSPMPNIRSNSEFNISFTSKKRNKRSKSKSRYSEWG